MTSSFAFANKGVLTVAGATPTGWTGGATPLWATIGVVKDVEITVSAEHVNLYGWGSIKRQAVAKHSAKVAVKVGFMKLDPLLTNTSASSFVFFILNPSAVTTPSGLLEDTNTVKLFNITANFLFESGENLLGTVKNVYFPNFPLKASEGQWLKVDMTGEGSDVVFTNP